MDQGADFRELFLFSGREEERDAGEGAREGTLSGGEKSFILFNVTVYLYTVSM